MAATKKAAAQAPVFTKTIALQDLRAGDAINARRTGRDAGLDELKASILAHGIVQSLRVRLVGQSHYEVIAGNRRFLALQQLEAEGKIEPGYLVPVIVGVHDDAAAHELSVVENVERLPVSPVDEFKAFGRLADDGHDAKAISARFGVPVARVRQRLGLAGLCPEVLAALDSGQINFDTAQAFTVAADHERQREVYAELAKSRNLYAYVVRNSLTQKYINGNSALAKMVGREAYLEAGGVIIDDLFQEATYWTSADIVTRLVEARWADRVAAWRADGWGWVMPAHEVPDLYERSRLFPVASSYTEEEQTRLQEIETELDAFNDDEGGWSEATTDRVNALEAERDAIEERYKASAYPADKRPEFGVVYWPAEDRVMFGIGAAGTSYSSKPEKKSALPPEDPAAVGPTVSQTLSAVLSDAIRTEVAADINLALPLLAAFMAAGQAGKLLPGHVSFGHATQSTPHDSKVELLESFRYFSEMGAAELSAAIAHMFANTLDVKDDFLDPKYRYSSLGEAGRRKLVADLVEIVDPRQFPEFDAAAYFAAVKKPLITAAFTEITGDTLKDGKKAEMAATVAKLAVEHGWLPMVLRGPGYEGPGSKAAAEMQEAAE